MDPYRRVLYNTFRQLEANQFRLIKLFVSESIPNEDITETSSFVEVCLALENAGQIGPPCNMNKIKEYFSLVNRNDLAQEIDNYLQSLQDEPQVVEIDQKPKKNHLYAIFSTVTSLVGVILAFSYHFVTGHSRSWLYTMLAISVLFIAIMLNRESIWYNYRYFKCTYGSIPGSLLHFQFTTFDLQDADVE